MGAAISLDRGAQVDSGERGEVPAEAEADRGVVVAAHEDQRDAGRGERDERVVEEPDGVRARVGPVVDVARDQDRVDAVLDRLSEQPAQELGLLVVEAGLDQGATEVPVRRVQQPHDELPPPAVAAPALLCTDQPFPSVLPTSATVRAPSDNVGEAPRGADRPSPDAGRTDCQGGRPPHEMGADGNVLVTFFGGARASRAPEGACCET